MIKYQTRIGSLIIKAKIEDGKARLTFSDQGFCPTGPLDDQQISHLCLLFDELSARMREYWQLIEETDDPDQ